MKSLFIISSVICVDKYSSLDGRTKYSEEERYQQTQHTIESIHKYCPMSKIMLVEGGGINKYVFQNVDLYRYYGDIQTVRKAVDSPNRGWGESMLLRYSIPDIPDGCDFIYKISGRYVLNEAFTGIQYDLNHFNFKVYERFGFYQRKGLHKWNELLKGSYSTRLYGLPADKKEIWEIGLKEAENDLLSGSSIEIALPRALKKEMIFFLNTAGVSGNLAGSGNVITE